MSLLRKSAIGGVVLVASLAGAMAADVPGDRTLPPPYLPPSPRYTPPDTAFSGWYLRGDIGYAMLKNSAPKRRLDLPRRRTAG